MKRGLVNLIVGLALLGTCGTSPVFALLCSQPLDPFGTAYGSHNETNPGGLGNFATAYDNFILSSPAQVAYVQWSGAYFNPPEQGPINSFTISFWDDNDGQPGSVLTSQIISGNANELVTGTAGIYFYSTMLSTPFTAAAGSTYWLSVVADIGFPPQWGWQAGTGGDGVVYQDLLGDRYLYTGADLAFNLDTTTVPEPSTFALLGISVVLFGYARRRRHRK